MKKENKVKNLIYLAAFSVLLTLNKFKQITSYSNFNIDNKEEMNAPDTAGQNIWTINCTAKKKPVMCQ